jgi:hypothetical protein
MDILNRHCEQREAIHSQTDKARAGLPRRASTLLAMTLLLFTFPAIAQDETPLSHTPEFCEFAAHFPEKPTVTHRCEDEEQKERCYDQISYTKVFDLDATVKFRLICNPMGTDIYKAYSGDVMQATLRALTKDSVIQEFTTSFHEEDAYKQAALIGEGKLGLTPTIFIAQLWMGQNSALSVEAELIGEPVEAADTLFSTILRSIQPKKTAIP